MNAINSVGKNAPVVTHQQNGLPNSYYIEESHKPIVSSTSRDNNLLKISYRPLNDVADNVHNDIEKKKTLSSGFDASQQNKVNTFEPEMTSTPMSLSQSSIKNIPDVIQPATLNSLVQSAAYDTKEKYDGPLVKVTIQNPRPYVPLSSELPTASKVLGKTSEVLTRSSYSETTLTRLTNNSLSTHRFITEVCI